MATTLATYTSTGVTLTASGADQSPFTVTATGTIDSSGTYGIRVEVAAAYIANAGDITGQLDAIGSQEALITIANTGTIASPLGYGVRIGAVTTVVNAGTIYGFAGGADIAGGAVSNTGTIIGVNNQGVVLTAGGSLANSGAAARIAGGFNGVLVQNAAGTVLNSGTITGDGDCAVDLTAGGVVANTSSYALMEGSEFGVYANIASTVLNAGTITGTGDDGVVLDLGGTVANTGAAALISGNRNGVELKNAPGTLLNAGTISGGNCGADVTEGGTVANTASYAVLIGGNFGVYANIAATVLNAGTIMGTGYIGADLESGGTVENTGAAALIAGAYNGVLIKNAPGTVLNTGTISGPGDCAVDLTAGGAVVNSSSGAVMIGGFFGVYANLAATVFNAGTIASTNFNGVEFEAGGTLTNSGTISGLVEAVSVTSGGFTLDALAGGVFDGGVTDEAGGGVLNLAGTQAGTLDMGGSFSGFSAISFGSADWTLEGSTAELADGQAITGFTLGDTLDLSGFSATAASYSAGLGLVLSNATASATLGVTGGDPVFGITGDGNGGTEIIAATHSLASYSATGILLSPGGPDLSPFTVTAAGTIEATGPITTLGSDGIYSSLGGAYLLNLGTIQGSNVGVSLGSGGTVTNAAGGTITGVYVGLAAANAPGYFSNAGTIAGTIQFGVYLGAGGSLTNTGVISAEYFALLAEGGATILNAGTISGTAGSGAFLAGGTLTNTGTISGAAKSGIFVEGGSVLNTASYSLIAGAKYGLVAEDAAVTVTNTGTIAGGSQEGIFLEGGVITNTASYSLISGSTDGIISESGSSSTIFNAGTITGASVDGVFLFEGGAVTNTGSAAVIYGRDYGVKFITGVGYITNAGTIAAPVNAGVLFTEGGTVTNTGTITGAETGVYLEYNGGTLTNAASGVITGQAGVRLGNGGGFHTFFDAPQSLNNAGLIAGTTDGIFVFGYPASTVINSGAVSAIGSGSGMYFEGGGYIGNSGTFSGGDGVKLADYSGNFAYALTLDNTGTLFGTGTGLSASDAGGGNETITNANLIYGAAEGVSISNYGAAYVSVINTGSIAGGNHGVYIVNGGTVTNAASGTITGAEAVRLGNGGGVANTGTASQSLDNAGLIAGSENGVLIRGSLSSLINTGTISGPGAALYFLGGGDIANAGTFAGGYGALLVDDQGIALTFSNTGSLLATGRALDVGGAGNQTLINQGFIYGEFIGAVLSDSGTALDTLINAGTILSQNFGVLTDTFGNTAIFNQGSIGDGVRLQDSGTNTDFLLNSGSISGSTGVEVYTTGGSQTIINRGIISGEYGMRLGASAASSTTIENAGTIAGAFGTAIGTLAGNAGSLTLIVDPGADFIGSVNGGGGVLEFAAGTGSLAGIGAEIFGFATFALDAGASWTVSGTLNGDADEVITGFSAPDVIDITNLTVPPDSRVTLGAAGTLALAQSGDTLNLTFSGDAGTVLTLTGDGATGTLIEEVTCFLRGTRIATARGQVKVEDLEIGDLVRTVHAGFQRIKWVGTRSYAAPFCNHAKVLPVRISAGAIADGIPARDLFVSPGHAISIDGALVHAGRLVNGATITQLPRAEEVTYFHIELENHEVILAENCPAETYLGEYFRAQFHNAASFAALYPGEQAPEMHALPPLSQGPRLDAILRRLRARAGIAEPGRPGVLRGYIDAITQTTVSGWAADLAAPGEPVWLDILVDEKRAGRVLANIARPDLRAAGYGAGHHGFEVLLPHGLNGRITVRRAADGTRLAQPMQTRRMGQALARGA